MNDLYISVGNTNFEIDSKETTNSPLKSILDTGEFNKMPMNASIDRFSSPSILKTVNTNRTPFSAAVIRNRK